MIIESKRNKNWGLSYLWRILVRGWLEKEERLWNEKKRNMKTY